MMIDRGVPVLAHANGDAAIELMIDGVEAVVSGAPVPDHRSVIIHAQLMRKDQLQRVAGLGIVPSFYSVHPFFGVIGTESVLAKSVPATSRRPGCAGFRHSDYHSQ